MYKDWGLLVFFLLLTFETIANAGQVLRRSAPQQTLYIPVRLDQNRYFVNVTMSTGPEQQTFNFALSTGTGYTVVAGTDCSTCHDSSSYNVSESTTVQQLPNNQNVSLLDGTASGALIREDCHLTQSNGSAWIYNNQTIIVANQTQSLLSNGVAGIIGLGTNARNGDFGSTVYSGWLATHPGVINFTFGMALNPPSSDSQSDGGVLHWLSPDPTAYEGDLIWKEMTPFDPSTEASTLSTQTDWFVQLDSWSFTSEGSTTSQNGGNLIAVLDPFEPNLIFPQNAASRIYSSIQGAHLLTAATTPTNQWSIPCDAQMKLTLTFGSLDVTLTEETLRRQQGSICLGTIEQWSDSSASEYFLGSSFISAIYAIFSVSGTNDSSIGIARRKVDASSPMKFNGGIIAGIVLGGLAFVLMVITTIILVRDRRKKRHQRDSLVVQSVPFNLRASGQQGYANDLPSLDSAQMGFAANGRYTSYDSPISPSFPITPTGLSYTHGNDRHEDGILVSPSIIPLSDDHLQSRPGEVGSEKMKRLSWRQLGGVLAYSRSVPTDSESTSPYFHGSGGSESENDTQMRVRIGRHPVSVPPPPYTTHTELEENDPVQAPSTSGEGSSRSERRKKRKVVMVP